MLKSEFTELTKQYVTESHYAEIEKRYYECNVDKATFCKWFKANKNGMAEAAARDAGVNEAIARDKVVKEWQTHCDELDRNYNELSKHYDRMYEKLGNRAKELYDSNVELTEKLNAEYEKVAQAEAKIKAKEQEIIELKAKLYDLMNK